MFLSLFPLERSHFWDLLILLILILGLVVALLIPLLFISLESSHPSPDFLVFRHLARHPKAFKETLPSKTAICSLFTSGHPIPHSPPCRASFFSGRQSLQSKRAL